MAAGLPVAATEVGDIRAILAPENAALLAPPGDVRALQGALATLAADPALRARLGKSNAARARENFDFTVMQAAYENAYARALGGAF